MRASRFFALSFDIDLVLGQIGGSRRRDCTWYGLFGNALQFGIAIRRRQRIG